MSKKLSTNSCKSRNYLSRDGENNSVSKALAFQAGSPEFVSWNSCKGDKHHGTLITSVLERQRQVNSLISFRMMRVLVTKHKLLSFLRNDMNIVF